MPPCWLGDLSIATEDVGIVVRASLTPTPATSNQPIQLSSTVSMFGKTRAPVGLALSSSGTWLVAIGGHTAYVASPSSPKNGFTKFVSPERLTCLTFHPSEEYFATGDDKGVIRLWYCLSAGLPSSSVGVEKKAQTTALHWHAHAVSSVAFTANGAYLLSGGEEAVLVIWQLHSSRKEFVPRVGAPIVGLAVSKRKDGDEEYLLSLADASFVFVRSATLRISKTVSRIKLGTLVILLPLDRTIVLTPLLYRSYVPFTSACSCSICDTPLVFHAHSSLFTPFLIAILRSHHFKITLRT